MSKSEAIIIGWINKGKPADCGETMKNQLMIRKLEELGIRCRQIDFKNWKRHPWVFFQLVWDIVVHRDNTLVLSTSASNIYLMIEILKKLNWKVNCIHWVIGGNLQECINDGKYQADVLDYATRTLEESSVMVDKLTAQGLHNVIQVPNFKPIKYYPNITTKIKEKKKLYFVFLGRIIPEKGIDYILEAACQLNKMGLQNKFLIDFYGKIDDSYESSFKERVDLIPNVNYQGFLNLGENEGYDKLSTYDMMLFPTYWKGEGFAGVFIDSFVSGVPMIVSDWAHNRQFLKESETALFVPVHDVTALYEKMYECIEGRYDLGKMAKCCQREAERYNVDNVMTKDLLKKVGLL